MDEDTWFHNRSEKDVFTLLIDSYRLRVEDEYKFQGECDINSLYGGGNPYTGFKKFLGAAERNNREGLPPWWSNSKRADCIAFARNKRGSKWSDLHGAVEKSDIIEHYGGDSTFPMQLRMVAEKFLLSPPTGDLGGGYGSGAMMREMMRIAEDGGETLEHVSQGNNGLFVGRSND